MDAADNAWLGLRLTELAKAKLDRADVEISEIEPLPGHAGLGFSFRLCTGAQDPGRRLVVRTIAEGVPATGPADVTRQARIMRSMDEAGVPVPKMVWFDDHCPVFGRPYFIGEFVEGRKIPDDWRLVTDEHRVLARRGMQALTLIHAAEWRGLESSWGAPQTLNQELDRLLRLFDRPTIDPRWAGRAPLLRERLLRTLPGDAQVGCVHGDFHWGNMVFGDDEVRAIFDWEIALVGPVLLDVGWICFYADTQSFIGAFSDRAKRLALSPDEMLEAYRTAWGRPVAADQVAWFRAFSAYRFGVISVFNLMLHRRGKRHDPMWEDMALSAPQMMERGLELLG